MVKYLDGSEYSEEDLKEFERIYTKKTGNRKISKSLDKIDKEYKDSLERLSKL